MQWKCVKMIIFWLLSFSIFFQVAKTSEQSQNGSVEENTENGSTENGSATNGSSTEAKEVTPELSKKIVKQLEYYFGNYNLPRDKFLCEEVSLIFSLFHLLQYIHYISS